MIKSGPGGCLVTCPQHKLSSFGSASISSHDDDQNHADDDDLNHANDDEDDDDDDDDGGDEGRFLGKHLFSTCWHFFVFLPLLWPPFTFHSWQSMFSQICSIYKRIIVSS